MAIGYGVPCPKPKPRVLDRVQYKRAHEKRARDFRTAVWLRDDFHCRSCGRHVYRTLDAVPERGEVHHRRGRNVAPEDRYNVTEAVLLCLVCHSDPAVIARFRR